MSTKTRGRPDHSFGPDGYVLIMNALEEGPLNIFQITEKTGIKIKSSPSILTRLITINAVDRFKGENNLYYYTKLVPTITRSKACTMYRNNEKFNNEKEIIYLPQAVKIEFSRDERLQEKQRQTDRLYRRKGGSPGKNQSSIYGMD